MLYVRVCDYTGSSEAAKFIVRDVTVQDIVSMYIYLVYQVHVHVCCVNVYSGGNIRLFLPTSWLVRSSTAGNSTYRVYIGHTDHLCVPVQLD